MRDFLEKKTSLPVIHNLIITTAITLFFLGVIVAYYGKLYDETRDNIILNAELNAIRSANQIDKRLYTGIDAIKLTSYTLDNMLLNDRSHAEIHSYLEDQSFAAAAVILQIINGVYGYIDGEYMDGVNWVPDKDYEPTERPWYIEAMARPDEVAVIDPYLDAQTGSMIITFSKMLGDGDSVVAIDVSLGQLQSLTEEIAAQGNSDIEIILDKSYNVISHSSKDEVGKNYAKMDGSFGAMLVSQLRRLPQEEKCFSLHYANSEYVVYAMSIENNWICVSVTDATASLTRLKTPLILTMLTAAVIIGILALLMIRSIRKDRLAEDMKQLAAKQTEYAYNDQMTGLKNRRAYAEQVEKLTSRLPKDCCVVIFDVNGLKVMNDTRGHEAGDELIIAAAVCIREAFAEFDTVYRTGGDEFCVIAEDSAEGIASRLERLEKTAASWKGQYVNGFSVSYGTGLYRDGTDIDTLIKEADRNMYDYKSRYYSSPGIDRRHSR